jgi:hypothetical protein
MSVTTKYFPFLMGLDQTVDDRLLEPGRPRAIENLAIRKKGRLGMRYDYDSLGITLQNSGTWTPFDLATIDSRLLAIGERTNLGFSPLGSAQLFSFENQPGYAWRAVEVLGTPCLPLGMHLRGIAQAVQRQDTVDRFDVAAGSGRVCTVWFNSTTGVSVHIVDTTTNATLLFQYLTLGAATLPRVVCIGSIFFIGCVDAGTTPKLFRFNPATDSLLTALTDPAAAGAAITCFDMSVAHEGTTFWMAYGRTGPTTRVHGFDSAGTETHDFAGPAVLCDAITIFTEATIAATGRINLACVINGTGAVNMSTYLVATSALQTNTPALFANAISQVGMSINGSGLTPNIVVSYQRGLDIQLTNFTSSTHANTASGNYLYESCKLNSKQLTINSRALIGVRLVEASDGSGTNMLLHYYTDSGLTLIAVPCIPSAVADRLIAAQSNVFHLQNIARDASTNLGYWCRSVVSTDGKSGITVSEVPIATQDRRQTAQIGDCLYIAGAIVSVYDGRVIAEADWLDRPVTTFVSQAATGALALLGVYQFVALFEGYDAHGNRVQSAPSDVLTVMLTGANNSITVSVTGPHTLRNKLLVYSGTFASIVNNPRIVLYRTQNNNGGNLTFFRDQSVVVTVEGRAVTFVSIQTDTALGAGDILYTQGARGALSGPLPFVAPEGCASLAVSADRVLTGALDAAQNIEESRPLFVAEQVNWNDGIGFQRSVRGQILAVARLDERRIAFTATELFEIDGPGLDDNGNGDIGAPRRLPSDVGLFGGRLGWRSMVECSFGILFQGLADQIYLLPRGGVTPQPIGISVQDRLAAFPSITAAVYMASDQTVRFTCNNSATAPTDSIQLIYDIIQREWVTEGPFGVATAAAAPLQNRLCVLQGGVVRQQRTSHPPAALIANAWRSGTLHPFGLGQFGRVLGYQFYGEYRGDCLLRCIATYDDQTVETMKPAEVNAFTLTGEPNAAGNFSPTLTTTTPVLSAGSPFSFKFTPNQIKCECVRVDFEVDIPFPNVIAAIPATANTAVNAVNLTLSPLRQAGDRVVVIMNLSNSGANVPGAAGWTTRFDSILGGGTSSRQTVFERILDGSEVSPLAITWTGTATAAFVLSWTLRNSHPTAPIEVANLATAAATTNPGPLLAPSWGSANTRWIAAICLEDRTISTSNLIVTPDAFGGRGIASAAINVIANLSGQSLGGDRALAAASLSPGAWGWVEASQSRAFTIAIRPNPSIASEALVYHYWAMDVEDAGKSALKSPLQMG